DLYSGADRARCATPARRLGSHAQAWCRGMSPVKAHVNELERSVLAQIDPEQLAGLCGQLIQAPSENPGGNEESTVLLLQSVLQDLGATVHLQYAAPGRPNLIAHLGGGNAGGGLLFLGHSDVVPAGSGWDADPFT